MMIELRIVNAAEAVELLEEGWPHTAISLIGDDLRFPLRRYGSHHLILNFHDVEEEVAGYLAPTEAKLREALFCMHRYARLGIVSLFTATRGKVARRLWR